MFALHTCYVVKYLRRTRNTCRGFLYRTDSRLIVSGATATERYEWTCKPVFQSVTNTLELYNNTTTTCDFYPARQ